jgi:hypothetical protein
VSFVSYVVVIASRTGPATFRCPVLLATEPFWSVEAEDA